MLYMAYLAFDEPLCAALFRFHVCGILLFSCRSGFRARTSQLFRRSGFQARRVLTEGVEYRRILVRLESLTTRILGNGAFGLILATFVRGELRIPPFFERNHHA